ncbi:ABC transporter substrate-binding protein [Vineibacter terrae]|uniref:ABC transporter substrate-binding protein n=1 Tax=Vineibacter terrae TaxID=2586908 RepID=UPI002E31E5AF|nr:ABC transporter substrate-binding protein [Vineibacter terrae]HEX2885006.1 ABC transporter substrate-binding protein [Vineibacter terrae]
MHMRLARRRLLLTSAALGAVGATTLAAPAVAKPEKAKVVLAVGGKSGLYYLSLTIAERLNYFKDEGLDVEINDFQGGAKSLQALMGGSADVVAGAYEHTIRMQQRGQPIVGFALIGRGMQLAIALLKDRAAKVKSPADIKGMKFGVSAPGSQTHMLVNYWAAKGGLKPSDIVAIGVGAGASVIAAVEKGEIDGISQTDPSITMLDQKGLIKVMVDTRTMKGNQELFGGSMPAACLYAQPDLLKKTPGTTQALANAIVRANQWLHKAAPEEVAKTVPENYLLGDPKLYMAAFTSVRETISPDGVMPDDGPANCLKFLAEGDKEIKPDKAKLAATWTNEFVKRAGQKT